MIAVLGGLADVERDLIRTRAAEGRSRAKARGQHMGRIAETHPATAEGSTAAAAEGATLKELAKSYNVGRATISRVTDVTVPYIATPDERVLHQRVSDLTLKVARPLVRYSDREPWPKPSSGGTCFILRFDRGLIGVTADHVISAFEEDKRKDAGMRCLLRTVPFDLLGAVLAPNADLDIATFAVTEDDLTGSEAVPLDCRSTSWLPPAPNQGDPVSLGGFPGEIAKQTLHFNVEFCAFVTLAFIQDVTQRDIIVTYEPTRDSRVVAAAGLPELGANLSGCSGGPVLLHSECNGLHRWFPVGMMVAGPREQGTGISAEFDILRLRRIHFIQPDGTIGHSADTACCG